MDVKKDSKRIRLFGGDKMMWGLLFLMAIVSAVVVFSAGSRLYYRHGDYSLNEFLHHLITLALGLGAAVLAANIRYTRYSRFYRAIFWLAVILLFITIFFGIESNSARRDLPIPFIGLSFQPSEVAKIALVIYFSRVLVEMKKPVDNYKELGHKLIIPIGLMAACIIGESLSCVVILVATSLVMFIVAGVGKKNILVIVAVGVIGLLILMGVKKMTETGRRTEPADVEETIGVSGDRSGTRKNRIERWLQFPRTIDPERLHQEDYAWLAIANGGFIRVAPGKSNERYFLAESHNDFIYAIIIEEYGAVLGGLGMLAIYVLLMFRALRLYRMRPVTFGGMLAFGITFSLVFQAFVNMGIVVGLLPVTGETLPFISKGGTSLVITGFAIGIVINISKVFSEETNNETNESEQLVESDN